MVLLYLFLSKIECFATKTVTPIWFSKNKMCFLCHFLLFLSAIEYIVDIFLFLLADPIERIFCRFFFFKFHKQWHTLKSNVSKCHSFCRSRFLFVYDFLFVYTVSYNCYSVDAFLNFYLLSMLTNNSLSITHLQLLNQRLCYMSRIIYYDV